MQLIFDTMTGNTRRFAQKVAALTSLEAIPVAQANPQEPYLLLTYTSAAESFQTAPPLFSASTRLCCAVW